jgi:pimeloyl-ACP methyl ester carboxylesterase
MMRLLARRNALDFLPCVGINHAHIGILRVEHEEWRLGSRTAGGWSAGWGCWRLRKGTRQQGKTGRSQQTSYKLQTLQNKDFQLRNSIRFYPPSSAGLRGQRLKTLQNTAMTAPSATEIEKVTVFGVNLELMHIAAPTSTPFHAAKSPIVFLHEGLGSVAMWRDTPAQLCLATGRAGLVYSRRGYGQSDAVPDIRGAGRLQADYMHREASEVLPELLRICGIEKPALLGHSDGGTIALLYAAEFATEACIVMAPHLFVEDISIAAISQATQAFQSGDLRARLAKFHADVDCAFWQWNDVWLSAAFRSFNIVEQCKKITCPLLAIQGEDDPYGTMAQIDALGGAPFEFSSKIDLQTKQDVRKALLKLEQCGHSPHRDQSERVIKAIANFIQCE